MTRLSKGGGPRRPATMLQRLQNQGKNATSLECTSANASCEKAPPGHICRRRPARARVSVGVGRQRHLWSHCLASQVSVPAAVPTCLLRDSQGGGPFGENWVWAAKREERRRLEGIEKETQDELARLEARDSSRSPEEVARAMAQAAGILRVVPPAEIFRLRRDAAAARAVTRFKREEPRLARGRSRGSRVCAYARSEDRILHARSHADAGAR